VIARFEAERQALAIMDHPNIARVFDAGTTDAGRPYFAMEMGKGVPITKQRCDRRCWNFPDCADPRVCRYRLAGDPREQGGNARKAATR
jgi:hypothetical protein